MSVRKTAFPAWLRKRITHTPRSDAVRKVLSDLRLETVCRSAHCPNLHECYGRGTATFMLMGNVCTRHCRFCAVAAGRPAPLANDEPGRIAQAVAALHLRHVVLTSVTRDDLADGGAAHFAATIGEVRRRSQAIIEVLTPDFLGQADSLAVVLAAGPDIFNHNVETVPRLYPRVRPEADYARSLGVLTRAARRGSSRTKSGFMVGLGETLAEVTALMGDLRGAGVEMLTIGQYLRPSQEHLPVERFVPPEEFDRFRQEAEQMGFAAVAAGPFVRSSYNAEQVYKQMRRESAGCDTK